MAKAYNLYFEQHPELVSKGAMTNFTKFADVITEKWGEDDNLESSDLTFRNRFNYVFYREIAVAHIIIDRVGKIVSRQEWYDGSYRANIV